MKVNAQAFFNFCAAHVLLMRQLAERTGELSAAEVMRIIRDQADVQDELPETAWRRLREYQILVPTEPGGDSYLLAEPVARLLTYLQNNANPATPEIIRGYVQSLDTLAKQLANALETENVTVVGLAFNEIATHPPAHPRRPGRDPSGDPCRSGPLQDRAPVGAGAGEVPPDCLLDGTLCRTHDRDRSCGRATAGELRRNRPAPARELANRPSSTTTRRWSATSAFCAWSERTRSGYLSNAARRFSRSTRRCGVPPSSPRELRAPWRGLQNEGIANWGTAPLDRHLFPAASECARRRRHRLGLTARDRASARTAAGARPHH